MKACRSGCFVCVRFRENGDHKNTTEHCKARGGLTMSCLAPRRARPYPSSEKSCEAPQHPLDPMHFFAQMPTNATENRLGPLPTHGRRCPSVADPRRLIRVSGLSVSDTAAMYHFSTSASARSSLRSIFAGIFRFLPPCPKLSLLCASAAPLEIGASGSGNTTTPPARRLHCTESPSETQ